jgi:hypothetical protein
MPLLELKPQVKKPVDAYVEEVETAEVQEAGLDHKECVTIVSEQVCIQADVKILPKVKVGRVKTICEDAIIGRCARVACNEACEFTVSRALCVQIPLVFSADTFVRPAGHVCGEPELEPCRKCDSDY